MSTRFTPRRLRDQRGAAMVEFAIILPLLLLVVFGILQFGLLFYNYLDLTSATRDGARRAAVSRLSLNGAQTTRDAIAASTSVVDDSQTTVTITPGTPWTSGNAVNVKVTYPYELNVMGITVWSGPMVAESVARVE